MVKIKRLICSTGIIVIAMTAVVSCLERYDPPITRENANYLVVDAFLNTDGHVDVKLSRTLPLYSTDATPVESGAEVYIEGESGNTFLLTEIYPGHHSANVSVDLSEKYRVHISTVNGESVFSEYVRIKITPPIDSVYWKGESDGVAIYLDTHDPDKNSLYYKWNFRETFEYTAAFGSELHFIDGVVTYRKLNELIYRCWRTDSSSDITVGTSVNKNINAIQYQPIQFLEKGSRKLIWKYSILVEQRALSEAEYNYWLQLEQSTESLGGLFDRMPADVTGNFYSVSDPSKQVIGFFGAGSVSKKRMFIDHNDLDDKLKVFPGLGCVMDSIPLDELGDHGNSTLLITAYGSPFVEGYMTSTNLCIDCRLQGGTTTRPDFWE